MVISKKLFYNYVIFFGLLSIFMNSPFISDVLVPKAIRYVPPFMFLCFFVSYIHDRKIKLFTFFALINIALVLLFFWSLSGKMIVSNALMLVYSCIMFFMVVSTNESSYTNRTLLIIWDKFVWISIFSTICSFLIFNIVNKLGFRPTRLGNYDEFNTYFNPALGGISVRNLVSLTIGRVSWFLSEPSYMGFIHGLNIFWFSSIKKNISRNCYLLGIGLSILALMFTLSFGSFVSLTLAIIVYLLFNVGLFLLNSIKVSVTKLSIWLLVLLGFTFLVIVLWNYLSPLYIFIDEYFSNMDKYSSLNDRTLRMENSIKMIREMSLLNFAFGYGPGSIESIFEKGESNGWLKSFIEVGLIPTILYFGLLFKFVLLKRQNLLLFAFVVISFNSIIIMFSPLVIFYLAMIYFQNVRFDKSRDFSLGPCKG